MYVCHAMTMRLLQVLFLLLSISPYAQTQDSIVLGNMLNQIDLQDKRLQNNKAYSLSIVKAKEIQRQNIAKDFSSILSTLPSAVNYSDNGIGLGHTNLRIRGTDPSRISVCINGIPFNNPEYNWMYWVELPDLSSSVSSVEVQRGVGSSNNSGSSFGANINIVTSNNQLKPYLKSSNSIGSFNTRKHNVLLGTGLLDNNWSFDVRLSELSSDGFVNRSNTEQNSLFLSGSYFGEKYMIKTLLLAGAQKTYFAFNGIPLDSLNSETGIQYNPIQYENAHDRYGNINSQLHYIRQLNSKSTFTVAGHYSRGEGPSVMNSYITFADYGLEDVYTDNDTIFSTNIVSEYNIDNHFAGMIYTFDYQYGKSSLMIGGGSNFYKANWSQIITSADFGSTIPYNFVANSNDAQKSNHNIYAKYTYKPIEGSLLFADLQYRRVDYSIVGSDFQLSHLDVKDVNNFFNPKFGVTYSLNENHLVFMSYGVANKEPNRVDYTNAVQQNPLSQRLQDLELGYKYQSKNALLNANFYYMNYENQLVQTGQLNELGLVIRTNVPQSYRMGLELESASKISKKISLNANLSISRNKIKEFVEYIDDWDSGMQIQRIHKNTDISFSPNIVASTQLNYQLLNALNLRLESKYVGQQYIDNSANENRMLNDYILHSFSINYKIPTQLFHLAELTLLVNNLLNERYAANAWVYQFASESFEASSDPYVSGNGDNTYNMTGYFPQATRNFLLGLNLTF